MAEELPDFDLERYLPYRFTVLSARMSTGLARQYKAKYGISMPEWRVLLNVGYSENLSVRDIEKRVNLEKSKASRAVSRLEANGYLEKQTDSADRRLLKLTLTDKGIELLGNLIPIADAFQAELDNILGEQREGLHEALDRLLEETT